MTFSDVNTIFEQLCMKTLMRFMFIEKNLSFNTIFVQLYIETFMEFQFVDKNLSFQY